MTKVYYDQDYIKKCFDTWYLSGRPSQPKRLQELLTPYEQLGHKPQKPSTSIIKSWMVTGAWDAWADELDARAIQVSDTELVNKKAQMLIKHQEDAKIIAERALKHLKDEKFDSSSAAVNAYFRATEEQRKTAGFSDLLERLDKMTNNEVEKNIIDLLNRASENDQIIDTDSKDVPELISGEEEE